MQQSLSTSLNPYSTGSNSNTYVNQEVSQGTFVLILILLEVTQITLLRHSTTHMLCLNPYSTGSNSNFLIRLSKNGWTAS